MKEQQFFKFDNYEWDGIEKIDYKPSGEDKQITFQNTSRQNLIAEGNNTQFHQRYFECGVDGFSTLEKHEHVHVVIIARGKGKVIVGNEIYDAQPLDLVVIPSWTEHQLINTGEEPFGFFCTVNGTRDKFQTLTKEEIEKLKENPEIAKYIKVHEKYFGER
ncbi:MAG TPA: cupin domain-containing protein [Eubacteriaceae bacterium]|nr:cupin domain-containing protein [Eubacteriaceae bacterium]